MIHGQHPIVVHVYIRLHSARLSTTFNDPHLPSWNVFFFSSFFRTVCFHFPFPLIVRFLNFLFAPEKNFLLPLYEDDKEKFSNSMAVGDPPMFWKVAKAYVLPLLRNTDNGIECSKRTQFKRTTEHLPAWQRATSAVCSTQVFANTVF